MLEKHKVRVLIVDDSIFFQIALKKALSTDPAIEIVGVAGSPADAGKKIEQLSPDVVTLDEQLPGMTGMEFLKKLMPVHPVPVVIVSSMNIGIFEALHAGAVDFVRKPEIKSDGDFQLFCRELSVKIKIASTAKVKKNIDFTARLPQPALRVGSERERIIAIGASTGGTEATLEVIRDLPADIPGMVITQHMPAGFTKMYAERLNNICRFSVSEAKDGDRVVRGRAFIAPGENQMTLAKDSRGYFVHCAPGDKVSGHCPSVDVLFRSVAKAAGADAIGVILTGMGKDGADGLLEMRKNGAYTIGQDKNSCVVYGMPGVAFEIGAVIKQAPCQNIGGILIQELNKKTDNGRSR